MSGLVVRGGLFLFGVQHLVALRANEYPVGGAFEMRPVDLRVIFARRQVLPDQVMKLGGTQRPLESRPPAERAVELIGA